MVRIQAAAYQLGIPVWSLRSYERRGIVPQIRRNPGGQRVYTSEDLERIRDRIAVARTALG